MLPRRIRAVHYDNAAQLHSSAVFPVDAAPVRAIFDFCFPPTKCRCLGEAFTASDDDIIGREISTAILRLVDYR